MTNAESSNQQQDILAAIYLRFRFPPPLTKLSDTASTAVPEINQPKLVETVLGTKDRTPRTGLVAVRPVESGERLKGGGMLQACIAAHVPPAGARRNADERLMP